MELGLRIDLTTPLIASRGMAAPEMGETIIRARALCERLGETTRLFPVLYGQWVVHHVRGQVTKGLEFARLVVAGANGDVLPHPRAVTPTEIDSHQHELDVQRERCLLYVASTRARDELVVTSSGVPSELLPAGRR